MNETHQVNFVILTQARTGSNMLVSLLNNHPEIQCIGEALNPNSSFGYEKWVQKSPFRKITNKYLRDYSVESYLDSILAVKSQQNIQASGFKIIYPGQFDRWSNFRYYWRTHNFKVISLIRHNLLRKYVSSKIANVEDTWSAQKHRGKVVSINIDISDLNRQIIRFETIYKLIDSLTIEFRGIKISYEELSTNKEACLQKISDHLGTKDFNLETLSTKTVKQNPAKLDELIENYDEVCGALNHTQYEWFLDEPLEESS